MDKKIIKKFSNYHLYSILQQSKKRPISEERLMKLIQGLRDRLGKPYLRFMTVTGEGEACAVVYDGDKHVTKLVTVDKIEQMIKDNKFTK